MAAHVDDTFDVVCIVVETRPILGSSNISIFVANNDGNIKHMSVTVQESIIFLKFYLDDEICSSVKLVFPNAKFVPQSCAGLTGMIIPQEQFEDFRLKKVAHTALEVSFHVRLIETNFAEQGYVSSCLPSGSETSNIFLPTAQLYTRNCQTTVDLNPVRHRYLQCKFCMENFFVSAKSFKKVLELPSENWEEVSSDWFCHRHEENKMGSLFDSHLLNDSIFVSALHYKLNCELLCNVLYDANELHCRRCNSHIGSLQESSDSKAKIAVIVKSKIIFSEHGNKCVWDDKGRDNIGIMTDLIQKHLCSTLSCKICFDSKPEVGEKGISILIWVMDSRLARYCTSLPITRTNNEHHLDVMLTSVIRVLYGIAPRDSAQASSWRKDFSIEVEEVDQGVLWPFIKHLLDSSKSVPPSQRFVEKLMIGYLSFCS